MKDEIKATVTDSEGNQTDEVVFKRWDENQIKQLIIKEIRRLEARLRQSLEDAISKAVIEVLAESLE